MKNKKLCKQVIYRYVSHWTINGLCAFTMTNEQPFIEQCWHIIDMRPMKLTRKICDISIIAKK